MLTQGKNLEQLVQILIDEYDVQEEQLRQDVQELLEQLSDAGLIRFDSL